jgi:HK97 family phage prohead protease
MSKTRESFIVPGVEVRVKQDGTSRTIIGLLPYGTPSTGLPWIEMVEPGAFTSALKPGALVRALRDHNTSQILASTKAGTLQLLDTVNGLQFKMQLPDASYANDLIESMQRGDISSTNCCSFGFVCLEDAWSKTNDGQAQRKLLNVELFEISIVSGDAAYPDSQAALRSIPEALRSLIKRSAEDAEDEDDDCACEKDADGNLLDPECHCDDDEEDGDDEEERSKPLTWAERTQLEIDIALIRYSF